MYYFLDELPEFDRKVLEVSQTTLESKEIVISRVARQMTFPANFQFIAAMNPCPCGYALTKIVAASAHLKISSLYQNRISGPFARSYWLTYWCAAFADKRTTRSKSAVKVHKPVASTGDEPAYQQQIQRNKFESGTFTKLCWNNMLPIRGWKLKQNYWNGPTAPKIFPARAYAIGYFGWHAPRIWQKVKLSQVRTWLKHCLIGVFNLKLDHKKDLRSLWFLLLRKFLPSPKQLCFLFCFITV